VPLTGAAMAWTVNAPLEEDRTTFDDVLPSETRRGWAANPRRDDDAEAVALRGAAKARAMAGEEQAARAFIAAVALLAGDKVSGAG
jgi:hypothetical protein